MRPGVADRLPAIKQPAIARQSVNVMMRWLGGAAAMPESSPRVTDGSERPPREGRPGPAPGEPAPLRASAFGPKSATGADDPDGTPRPHVASAIGTGPIARSEAAAVRARIVRSLQAGM